MSFILCAGAIAAPSRGGWSRSAHARRDRIGRSAPQNEIAKHKRDDARWLRLTSSRKRARAAVDVAPGLRFQRGDVFMMGNGIIYEYLPVGTPIPNSSIGLGQLRQMIPSPGTGPECFDPSGKHLIVPGSGLFDSSGKLLPSHWASITNTGRCVADGLGHVYVSSGAPPGPFIVAKYDRAGNFIQATNISVSGEGPLAIDLAPDECTMYYTGFNVNVGIGRFNVCTNTQEPPFLDGSFFLFDDLRVLPNWQVLTIGDASAALRDVSGSVVHSWGPSTFVFGGLRTLSVNPDGRSFWTGGDLVSQVDLNSGQLLENWASTSSFTTYSSFIAVDSPPLLGDANVERTLDSNPAGTAEAFSTTAGYSGQMTRLHLWVDSSSTASKVVVGVYADHNGHPGRLQTQETDTNLRPGSWNYVDVPSTPVTKGQRHWIAVLAPTGGGTLSIRDTTGGGASQTSRRHKLTTLPAHWAQGNDSASAPVSAYAS